MKLNLLRVIGAVAILTGAALAVQFATSTTQDNVIAARLPGQWILNTDITGRLDPMPGSWSPRTFEFVSDPLVQRKLVSLYPRFAAETIYMSGTVIVNAEKLDFIVMNANGNANLVMFQPSRIGPMSEPTYTLINMVCSRDAQRDFLFIGGGLARESVAAYSRLN